jgi:hypothetical protein
VELPPPTEPPSPPIPFPDWSCDGSISLDGAVPVDVMFRYGSWTYQVCTMAVEGSDVLVSMRVTNAYLFNSSVEATNIRLRVGDQEQAAYVIGGPSAPPRGEEAVNAVLGFAFEGEPTLDGAAFVVGTDGEVTFEVPIDEFGEHHVPVYQDLGVAVDTDFGFMYVSGARIQTALDSRQAADGAYVVELDLEVWNDSEAAVFVSRLTSLLSSSGTAVQTGTSGSKDYDLAVGAHSQVHYVTFVYEILGEPGGTYLLTVTDGDDVVSVPIELPEVQFSPS